MVNISAIFNSGGLRCEFNYYGLNELLALSAASLLHRPAEFLEHYVDVHLWARRSERRSILVALTSHIGPRRSETAVFMLAYAGSALQ